MPRQTITPTEEIIRFVSLAQADWFSFTNLCEQFSICRKTNYKHFARYTDGSDRARPDVCFTAKWLHPAALRQIFAFARTTGLWHELKIK